MVEKNPLSRYSLKIPLILLVCLSLAIRLYCLERQTFWNDEFNEVQLLCKSWSKVFDLVVHHQIFYMFYIFVLKFFSYFGNDEFVLRLPAALSGTALVAIVYATCRQNSSRGASFLVASIMSVHAALLWFSRNATYYSLYFMLYSLSMLCFTLAVYRKDTKYFALQCISNCFLLLIGIGSLVFICVQTAVLLLFFVLSRSKLRLGQVVFPLGFLAIIVAAGSFKAFLNRSIVQGAIAVDKPWFNWVVYKAGLKLTFDPFNWSIFIAALVLLFVCVGICKMWMDDRSKSIFFLLVIIFSSLLIVLVYSQTYSYSHRFLYLLFLVIPFLAYGFDAIKKPKILVVLAVSVIVFGFCWNVKQDVHALYGEDESDFVEFRLSNLKKASRCLVSEISQDSVVIPEESLSYNYTLWYVLRNNIQSNFLRQHISSNQKFVQVYFLGRNSSVPNAFMELRDRLATPVGNPNLEKCLSPLTLYASSVERDPKLVLEERARLNVSFDTLFHFRHVFEQQNICMSIPFSGKLAPTVSGDGAYVIYKAVLPHPGNDIVYLNYLYDNNSSKNAISVAYSFDGVNYNEASRVHGVGFSIKAPTISVHDNGRPELYVKFSIINNSEFEDNWSYLAKQVALCSFSMSRCVEGDSTCSTEMLVATSKTGLSDVKPVKQHVVSTQYTLISSNFNGFDVITAERGKTGVIHIDADVFGRNLIFFPRVFSSGDMVVMSELMNGKKHIHSVLSGNGKEFTPIGMRVEIPTDHQLHAGNVSYEIEVIGGAQVFSRSGTFLFSE